MLCRFDAYGHGLSVPALQHADNKVLMQKCKQMQPVQANICGKLPSKRRGVGGMCWYNGFLHKINQLLLIQQLTEGGSS